jgi:uncharacterized membrane protein
MLLWRLVRNRPRLFAGVLCGLAAFLLIPAAVSPLERAILAWDSGCVVFLILTAVHFTTEQMDRMAEQAARDEEGEWTIFWITVGAVAASFAAIFGIFSGLKDLSPEVRAFHIALVAATLLLSWLVTHTLFAIRYAHEYYEINEASGDLARGLEFPGGQAPDYWDFFYFALVLGMTFQVSDVTIQARSLRRVATAHGILGFLFNTVILALSVNIGASLM